MTSPLSVVRARAIGAVVLGAVIALSAQACGGSSPSATPSAPPSATEGVSASPLTSTPSVASSSTTPAGPTTVPSGAASPLTTHPVPLGSTVTVPGWKVKVTGIDRHATAAVIRASGGFVTTPQFQYVLISFEATYTGTHASADVEDDLAWQLTTRHQTIPAAGTSPPAVYAHWPTATRPGGTVKFQVVFDVAPRSLRHAVLSVGRTGSSFGTVHGDFQL